MLVSWCVCFLWFWFDFGLLVVFVCFCCFVFVVGCSLLLLIAGVLDDCCFYVGYSAVFLFWFVGREFGGGCLLIASCFCFGLLSSGLLKLGFALSVRDWCFTVWLICAFGLLLCSLVCVDFGGLVCGFWFLVCCVEGVWMGLVVCGFGCFSGAWVDVLWLYAQLLVANLFVLDALCLHAGLVVLWF